MKSSVLLILAMVIFLSSAWAEITLDATSLSAETTGDPSVSHAGGTPEGVFLIVGVEDAVGANACLNGATYDGEDVPLVISAVDQSGELGTVSVFFKGSSVNPGTVTAACDSTLSTNKFLAVITVNANGDTQLVGTGTGGSENGTGYSTLNDQAANPSVTIGTITGASYGVTGHYSGRNAVEDVTAQTGETIRQQVEFGAGASNQIFTVLSSTVQQASGNHVLGVTQADDDNGLVGVVIGQVTPDSTGRRQRIIAIE